jgi:hypothetical protein
VIDLATELRSCVVRAWRMDRSGRRRWSMVFVGCGAYGEDVAGERYVSWFVCGAGVGVKPACLGWMRLVAAGP